MRALLPLSSTVTWAGHMKPLLLPYLFNIIILMPIALMTLFGGETGGQFATQGKFLESAGFRTLLGSIWTAILIGSGLGLVSPTSMSPLLLIQVIYKLLWLLVFVAPRLLGGRAQAIPWGFAITFLVIVVSYPLVIPWQEIFSTKR